MRSAAHIWGSTAEFYAWQHSAPLLTPPLSAARRTPHCPSTSPLLPQLMAKQEEALPPWGALSADMLQGVFAALPHAASRGACRRVCRHWRQVRPLHLPFTTGPGLHRLFVARPLSCTFTPFSPILPLQVADQGPEVWQYVHCRRAGPARYLLRSLAPTSDGEQREPGRRPPTLQELARLLSRQRAHLRRLTVEENAGDWENAAQALAVVLTAATTVGSGLTDLSLFVAEQLSDHVMEVRGSFPCKQPLKTACLAAAPGRLGTSRVWQYWSKSAL